MQLVTDLKYETKMFQKFITCLSDNLYFLYGFMYMLYFLKINFVCKALLETMFPVIAMQRFDFKNSIIAIKLLLVMILNLYLTSAWF